MKYIVYLTVNTVNNKIYIGVHKTEDPNKFDGYIGCGIRYATHTPTLETPFHRAVRKYGYDKFKRHIIKIFDNPEEAYSLERQLVDERFVQFKDTYNATLGGIPGSGYMRRKEIAQYSLSGKFITTFESISFAADYFNVSPGTLRQALVPPFKSRCGFQWRYITDEHIEYIGHYGTSLRVAQYDLKGTLIKVWDSVKSAAKSFNRESGDALRTYAGNHKIYEGFQWRLIQQHGEPSELIESICDPNIILQLSLNDEIIKEWNDKKSLYKEFKNVRDALNVRVKTYLGFKWMYKRDYINKDII